MSEPDYGAWVPGERVRRPPLAAAGEGALAGLRVAVKDLIDVEGSVTGCGNPDWAAAHAPARADAPCVQALRAAGAAIVGKTITDEFAFSLEGENAHYGTPRNPRAPSRLPGGSSSGSAVAVAAGLADVTLGTDTGGSVRVPASFCGVHGFRPTHGAVSLAGVMPFAPSYDTVGWFARSAALMQRVGRLLLPRDVTRGSAPEPLKLLVAADVFAAADKDAAVHMRPLAARLGAIDAVEAFGGAIEPWLQSYAVLQGAEIRATLGPWMAAHRPRMGTAIASRFASLDALQDSEIAHWSGWRVEQSRRLRALLADGHVLLLPTTPGAALERTATPEMRGHFYAKALAINALAGHAGLPQISLPMATLDGHPQGPPLGLSLLGAPGSDHALLDFAVALADSGEFPMLS